VALCFPMTSFWVGGVLLWTALCVPCVQCNAPTATPLPTDVSIKIVRSKAATRAAASGGLPYEPVPPVPSRPYHPFEGPEHYRSLLGSCFSTQVQHMSCRLEQLSVGTQDSACWVWVQSLVCA
jgi:hypothetical protein